jgi:hypothetical protein
MGEFILITGKSGMTRMYNYVPSTHKLDPESLIPSHLFLP